jgi:hypothetical protein
MGFFFLKDVRGIVDVHGIQGMKCVMCHGNGKVQSFEIANNTRDKKVLLPTTQSMASTT